MAVPPAHTVLDAMILCGVSNTPRAGVAGTDAERIAENIFNDDFEACMDYDEKELKTDMKTLSELRANQGKITLLPIVKKRILAFVQFVKDEIRMGRNPALIPFPVAEMGTLLKRMKTHDRWVEKSSNVPEPKDFTKDMKWDDWVIIFVDYLRHIPGRNGVPLSYVVRDDPNPDPTPHQDFLEEYVRMAPLHGDAFNEDSKEVLGLLNKFIVGNDQAEGAIRPLNTTTDGRGAFFAVKHEYEGQGLMMSKLSLTEKTVDTLFYKTETQFMHWKKFESILINAYAVIDKEAGRQVYDDGAKLRKLQQFRIRADYLKAKKTMIDGRCNDIPMTMTFQTALKIYRTAVSNQFPQGPNSRTARRGVAQVEQRGGKGRGGGGRGGGRGNRQNRRHNPTGRNHPDQETIVLANGQLIQYHPSYSFTNNEVRNMTDRQRERMRNERAAYRQRNNIPPRMNNRDRDSRIAEMEATIAALSAERSQTQIPDEVTPQDQATQVSQVTTGTARGSIYGGRNRQQRRREDGSRSVGQVFVGARTIASASNFAGTVKEPSPRTEAYNEWDSNADTCCLGTNFTILSYMITLYHRSRFLS